MTLKVFWAIKLQTNQQPFLWQKIINIRSLVKNVQFNFNP